MQPGGAHKIVAKGRTSSKSANATFTVKSALTRSPYQGPPGTPLSITVKGFGANETVNLSFIISSGNTVALGNATTNASGTGTISATMPKPHSTGTITRVSARPAACRRLELSTSHLASPFRAHKDHREHQSR